MQQEQNETAVDVVETEAKDPETGTEVAEEEVSDLIDDSDEENNA